MNTLLDDVITPQQAGTLYGLFVERARRSPDKVAYHYFQQNDWRDITWKEMLGEIARRLDVHREVTDRARGHEPDPDQTRRNRE